MSHNRRRQLFAYLMALALTLPVTAGWAPASPLPASDGRSAYASDLFLLDEAEAARLIGGGEQSGLRLVPLTGAEVAALGLTQAGVTAYQQPGYANPAFLRIWNRTDSL